MSEADAGCIQEMLEDPQFIENLKRKLEEEDAKAPHCFRCGSRCDPPFGNGRQCLVCMARPTAEDMSMIVY